MPETRKKRLTERRILFGQLAVKLGYVTQDQVEEALDIQKKMDERGEKHKLLGMIMLEKTMISTGQLITLLKHLNDKTA